ncbi:ClpP/crotonase-like domain-containing protein [Gongronella butleri]|nr:ClpP/crotonase-like domain-containing protein [Gongronella butleri]
MSSLPTYTFYEATLHPSGVYEFVFNQPQTLNALTPQGYAEWRDALNWAATDDRVKVFLMTGNGRYFCAGTQLSRPGEDEEGFQKDRSRRSVTQQMVDALIDFPKILIAAVNGPSYGIGVTTLGLFDIIYASEDATFTTPFMKLGFCAEGCSSYTFPRLLGVSRANEMLLMGRTIPAQEMVQCGFVSRLFSKDTLRSEALLLATQAAAFSPEAVKVTRNLVRDADRPLLHQINNQEFTMLHQRVRSPESIAAVKSFADAAEARRAAKREAGTAQSKL